MLLNSHAFRVTAPHSSRSHHRRSLVGQMRSRKANPARTLAVAAQKDSDEALRESLRKRLEVIQRRIDSATEEEYLAGLERAASFPQLSAPASPPVMDQENKEKHEQEEEDQVPDFEPAEVGIDGAVNEDEFQPREDLRHVTPEGTGREILLQAFHWESHHQDWWRYLPGQGQRFADLGVTAVWLPPPTASVSPQGYMPLDYWNLNSRYGSEHDLRKCIEALRGAGLKVLADIVINHRCASAQDKRGIWNNFGGKMDWDARAIVSDDKKFGGRGSPSSGDSFGAAPNLDHSQTFVKADITEWLQWMRDYIGFDGWRFDFVRGYSGVHIADYVSTSSPDFVVGEYWDSLAYNGPVPKRNQDAHRQRLVDYLRKAGGGSTAFDVTLKGILHAVFERKEYWRLKDSRGRSPGLMGWWPSKTVTFLENHDTGSTQGHWRFPSRHIEEGYAYIMTHAGTPSIFIDHLDDQHLAEVIKRLISIRKKAALHCRSKVNILKAEKDVYAACIDEKLVMKIGLGNFDAPSSEYQEESSGKRWRIWLKQS